MRVVGKHARNGSSHGPDWNRPAPEAHPRPVVGVLVLLAVLALLTSCAVVAVLTVATPAPPVLPISAPPPAAALRETPVLHAYPAGLRIPAIGVDSRLIQIDVDAAGVLQPPSTTDVAGWFVGSAEPGRPGPSVLAGHIDSRAGPGVFFRLRELTSGDDVTVTMSDGATVAFRVVEVQAAPKDSFPTQAVYGPTAGPELRLITCGGAFDRTRRRYLDNVIVSAVLVT